MKRCGGMFSNHPIPARKRVEAELGLCGISIDLWGVVVSFLMTCEKGGIVCCCEVSKHVREIMIESVSSITLTAASQMNFATFQKFCNVRVINLPFALKARRGQTLLDDNVGVAVDSDTAKCLVPFIVGFPKLEEINMYGMVYNRRWQCSDVFLSCESRCYENIKNLQHLQNMVTAGYQQGKLSQSTIVSGLRCVCLNNISGQHAGNVECHSCEAFVTHVPVRHAMFCSNDTCLCNEKQFGILAERTRTCSATKQYFQSLQFLKYGRRRWQRCSRNSN